MGKGKSIVTEKDLKLLERLLGLEQGYRLSELASFFDLDPQSVQPNLKRLAKYNLVDSHAEKASRGIAMFYKITRGGRLVYRVLQKSDDFKK